MRKRYSTTYQITHDIDWFAKHNGVMFHFASNGGKIPDYIKVQDNVNIQHYVANMDDNDCRQYEYYNHEIPAKIKDTITDAQLYYASFDEMASKGFVSFDNINPDSFEEPEYVVIASAKSNSNQGNETLLNMLPELQDIDIPLINDYLYNSNIEEYPITG